MRYEPFWLFKSCGLATATPKFYLGNSTLQTCGRLCRRVARCRRSDRLGIGREPKKFQALDWLTLSSVITGVLPAHFTSTGTGNTASLSPYLMRAVIAHSSPSGFLNFGNFITLGDQFIHRHAHRLVNMPVSLAPVISFLNLSSSIDRVSHRHQRLVSRFDRDSNRFLS